MSNRNDISTGQDLGLYSNVPAYWRNNLPNFIGINEELNPETNELEQKPIDVKTMEPASEDDAASWSSFDEVLKAKESGLVQKVGFIPIAYPEEFTPPLKGPKIRCYSSRSNDGKPFEEEIPVCGYAEKSADGLSVTELREGEIYGNDYTHNSNKLYQFSSGSKRFVVLEGRVHLTSDPSQFGVPVETDSTSVDLLDYLPVLAVGHEHFLNNDCSSSSELSWLLNNLANAWGYRKRYNPSVIGKSLGGLMGPENCAKVGDFTISREQRRIKKKSGDGGSQLQNVFLFIKTPSSVPVEQTVVAADSITQKPVYVGNKVDHPLFEYSKHPLDVVDLTTYYGITPYRGCQFAGVAIERDPKTKEPVRKLYVDLYTGWGASADDSDTLSSLEFAVWALNNSPKIEYIVCLPKSGDDLDKIEKANSKLCPVDIPVVSKPTFKEVSELDPMQRSYVGSIPGNPDEVIGSLIEEILYKYQSPSIIRFGITELTEILNEIPTPYTGIEHTDEWVTDMLSEAFGDDEYIIVHGITVPGMKISRSHATASSKSNGSASSTYTFERLVTT